MKTAFKIKRYVPTKAMEKLTQVLRRNPPNFLYKKEAFIFLLDLPNRLLSYNRELNLKEDNYIPISSEYIKKYITEKHYKYVDYLIQN